MLPLSAAGGCPGHTLCSVLGSHSDCISKTEQGVPTNLPEWGHTWKRRTVPVSMAWLSTSAALMSASGDCSSGGKHVQPRAASRQPGVPSADAGMAEQRGLCTAAMLGGLQSMRNWVDSETVCCDIL